MASYGKGGKFVYQCRHCLRYFVWLKRFDACGHCVYERGD